MITVKMMKETKKAMEKSQKIQLLYHEKLASMIQEIADDNDLDAAGVNILLTDMGSELLKQCARMASGQNLDLSEYMFMMIHRSLYAQTNDFLAGLGSESGNESIDSEAVH